MAQHWESGTGFDVSELIETTKAIFTDPTTYYQRTPKSGPLGRPLTYGVTVGSIGIAMSFFWSAVQNLALAGMHSASGDSDAAVGAGLGIFLYLGMIVFSPLWSVLGIFIGSGINHLCLTLVGGAKHGYDATLRVLSYAQAPQLLGVVPFCGGAIAGIWSMVLVVIGLREVHGCTTGQAILAVLLPMIVCCCCLGVMAFFFGAAIMAAVAGGAAASHHGAI